MNRSVFIWFAFPFLLAAGPAVRDGGAELRASCSADAESAGRLDAGAPLTIRFAFSGDIGTCYKVLSNGKTGYLLAGEITGLESYEQARVQASDRDLPQMLRAEVSRLQEQIGGHASAQSALRLIESGEPRQALQMIESSLLRGNRKDPYVLALAGLAAYKSDQPRRAVEYWTESQGILPHPSIEAFLTKARRELTADTSRNQLQGYRFTLRYDNVAVDEQTARRILESANESYARLDAALGCGLHEQVALIVQTRNAYLATTGAEEWSGGQFDGRIHVQLDPAGFGPASRQALTHEIVHACLARNGRFPAWFHEGMAMRWSGERPTEQDLNEVRELRQPPALGRAAEQARRFYSYAYLAVDQLYRLRGDSGVRAMVRRPELLPSPGGN